MGLRIVCALVAFNVCIVFLGTCNELRAETGAAEEPDNDSSAFRVLSSFPRHKTDLGEDDGRRAARLSSIADALDDISVSDIELAILISIIWHETRIAAYVQENRCSEGPRGKRECDGGKAQGLFQLHGSSCEWEDVECQARRALSLVRYGLSRCKGEGEAAIFGAFSLYATGNSCSWNGAHKRVRTFKKILGKL